MPTTSKRAPARRQPQDRRPKATVEPLTSRIDDDDRFSFVDRDGVKHTSARTVTDTLTPGMIRRNRADELSLVYAIVEALFADNDAAMAVLDNDWGVFAQVSEDLGAHMQEMIGASLGESQGSST